MPSKIFFGELLSFFSEPLFHGSVDCKLFADGVASEVRGEHVPPFDLFSEAVYYFEVFVAFV